MTKYKLMLPVLAVIVGIAASAFTVKPVARQSSQDSYYWFNTGVTTQAKTSVPFTTQSLEQTATGCLQTNSGCKDAYSSVIDNGNGTYTAQGSIQSTISKD